MRPGTILQHRYRLIAPIGEGGMGSVWRAEDSSLSAPVAVKLMHSREGSNSDSRARFEAEAKTAAGLRSPHVVQVFGAGIDEESGTPFIVMELLEGETLRDRLLRGPLTPAALAKVITHIARALTRAHEQHITHRDLKPSNVFLVKNAEDELAKVLDFGIAKRSSNPGYGSTATGEMLGTPLYMSPEQMLSSKSVDHRTDLWSLAVIAVECLTGRLPFESDNLPGLALLICQGRSKLPSSLGPVPAGFDEWFRRCTELSPERRFLSAAQMAEALRELCAAPDSAEPGRAAVAAAPSTVNADAPTAETLRREQPAPISVGPLSSTLVRRWLNPRRWQLGPWQLRGRLMAAAAAISVPAVWLALSDTLQATSSVESAGNAVGSEALYPLEQPAPAPERTVEPAHMEPAHTEPTHTEPTHVVEPSPPPTAEGSAEGAPEATAVPARDDASASKSPPPPRAAPRTARATRRAQERAPALKRPAEMAGSAAPPAASSSATEPVPGSSSASASPQSPAVPPAEEPGAGISSAERALPSVPRGSSAVTGSAAEQLSAEEGMQLLAINPRSVPYKLVAPPESLQGREYAPLVRICVSESGSVLSARISKRTNELLDRRIEETLSRWRYRQHINQGRPTPFCHPLIYRVQ